MLGYFKQHGLATIGLLSSADGFGQTGANMIAELAPSYGITINAKEEFGPRDTDMTAQVLKIRDSGADAMLIWSVNPGPTIILRNAKAVGYNKPIFNSYGGATQQLITQAGDAAEGTYVSSMRLLAPEAVPTNDPIHDIVNKIATDYQKKFGEAAPTFAAHTYDAMLIIDAAVKKIKGPITRDAIADAIPTVELPGGNGYFRFSATDHNGIDESSKPMVMMRVKNGSWIVVE
jgi:branched-chain amino acid transport system substrate-binding protein